MVGQVAVDLCDVNIWLALAISTHPHHKAVLRWVDDTQESRNLLFRRSTQHSFLRLLTTASVLAPYGEPPGTTSEAWQVYDTTLSDSRVTFLPYEPDGLETPWRRFTARRTASPKLWMDAYLAAFAVAGGLRLVTTDAAFRRFSGLDVLVLGGAAA